MANRADLRKAPSVWPPLLIGCAIVLVIYSVFTVALLRTHASFKPGGEGDREKAIALTGQFGDSFGMVNAAFSGLAFVALIVSLLLQRRDLQASLGEMKQSADAQTESAKAAQEQSEIQTKLLTAQLLRDRHEMYWRTYEHVSAEQVADLKLYPEEYMDRDLYESKYASNVSLIRRYIYMSRMYENLAFAFMIQQHRLPDLFGDQWMKLYCQRLVVDETFCDVHQMFRGYYPEFEAHIDSLLGKG